MSPRDKEEQDKAIADALLKENVKWLKAKHGDMHKDINGIKELLSYFNQHILNDEKTGEPGYFARTKALEIKHYETNERIDKLFAIRKFILSLMIGGGIIFGYVVKVIVDLVKLK